VVKRSPAPVEAPASANDRVCASHTVDVTGRSRIGSVSHPIARALVGYYVALQVSARAATLVLPFDAGAPPPIVRRAEFRDHSGFDPREIVVRGGAVHVVTMPLMVTHSRGRADVWLN
jgi:hypothetical protein